jgi:chromosome partitioning protein
MTTEPRLSRILAIANQKGGVAKTTTAVNLATAFAACGLRCLLVDLDPQANATSGLGIDPRSLNGSLYEVLEGEADLRQVIVATDVPGLELAPSQSSLASTQIDLQQQDDAIERLRGVLDTVKQDYDFVLIDCQPSLSLLPLNALVAADGVLVPLQTEYFALEGLSRMYDFMQDIKRSRNPGLGLYGILLTMVDHTNLSKQVAEDVRATFGSAVFQTEIPRNIKLAEAPSHGKPIILYDRLASGSKAYMALAAEILTKEGLRPREPA